MARTLHRAEPVHNELKRLAEARNQTYEMSALLAEFIDNSNSARRTPDQLVQVNLRVYKDDETDQLVLSVTDNASGIPDTSLGLIIGRGNSIGGGVNNEHGVGLKNAALNGSQYLRKLETKTLDASTSSVITFTCAEDTLQPFDIKDGTFLKSSGTRLEIVLPSEHALLNPESYYNALSELQVIYSKALGSRLSIEARNDVLGIPSLTLQGDPVTRHLANPVKADQSWIVEKKIKGSKAIPWTATLKVGFISPESLRPELPRTAGETKTPLHISKHGRSIQNQGIYFYKGDRLIVRTDNWTMGGLNVLDGRRGSNKHNEINGLVLEVHLDQHFSTTPTKNAYPNTPHYQELQTEIRAFLVGRRFLPDLKEGQTYADERGLYAQVKSWNAPSSPSPTKAAPLSPDDLNWAPTSPHATKWTSLGTFGSWKCARHGNNVVLTHVKGKDAPIEFGDVPHEGSLRSFLKSSWVNITVVHDGPHTERMLEIPVYASSKAAKAIDGDKRIAASNEVAPPANLSELAYLGTAVKILDMLREHPRLRASLQTVIKEDKDLGAYNPFSPS